MCIEHDEPVFVCASGRFQFSLFVGKLHIGGRGGILFKKVGDCMLNKKNIKMHLLSLFILCAGFVLCRYVFFDIHGMKQLPAALFGVGMVFLAISIFLRGKMAPIIITLAYLIGFVAGVVFETDGIDAGGGATNNLWIIWTTVFICFSVICIITESAYSTKKRISKSKSDKGA